ncbi:hypothetical protein LIER_15444 [Lithospermum erythrorhizon]|uniref:Uncharacterized protein n=1 Tax=Lithospermum erythrorhizon TaxID=34254 RepID=A0AAV3Q7J0_LITER
MCWSVASFVQQLAQRELPLAAVGLPLHSGEESGPPLLGLWPHGDFAAPLLAHSLSLPGECECRDVTPVVIASARQSVELVNKANSDCSSLVGVLGVEPQLFESSGIVS